MVSSSEFKIKKVRSRKIILFEKGLSNGFKLTLKIVISVFIAIVLFWGTMNYGGIEQNFAMIKGNSAVTDKDWSKEPNRLVIPKLKLFAKVSFPQKGEDIEILLRDSVVHLPETVLPGESGNSIITAHSSNIYPGYYSNIFSTLNWLQKGDEVILYKENKEYLFIVSEKLTVFPNEIYKIPTNGNNLVLATCWPLGTDLKRLIVTAKLWQ